MIIPDKYTDFNKCLLYISSKILTVLKNVRKLKLLKLEKIISNYNISTESNEFKYALDLLYCLGIIDFEITTDEIYLVREVDINETC